MELNIVINTGQQSEQLVEDKKAKRMTKVSKQERRIAIVIPKASIKKIKNGQLKEFERGEEVMLEHVKKWN